MWTLAHNRIHKKAKEANNTSVNGKVQWFYASKSVYKSWGLLLHRRCEKACLWLHRELCETWLWNCLEWCHLSNCWLGLKTTSLKMEKEVWGGCGVRKKWAYQISVVQHSSFLVDWGYFTHCKHNTLELLTTPLALLLFLSIVDKIILGSDNKKDSLNKYVSAEYSFKVSQWCLSST